MLAAYLTLLRRNRNYRLLWLAQIVSELGDWFYTLAVYNLLLDLTGSKAQAVGLAVVLQVLPSTFAAPTAGVLNDRISRKRIMIGADLVRFFIVLGMLLVRTPSMVWLVYPLLLVETIGAAFFEPAHSSVIPNIVPENQVLTANALASITWSFCLAAGASLGGIAAVWLGRDAVFVLNACSFLLSAWLIRRMSFAEPHAAGSPAPARPRTGGVHPDPRGHPLHPPRSPPLRHRLRQRRHRTARRQQRAAPHPRRARFPGEARRPGPQPRRPPRHEHADGRPRRRRDHRPADRRPLGRRKPLPHAHRHPRSAS